MGSAHASCSVVLVSAVFSLAAVSAFGQTNPILPGNTTVRLQGIATVNTGAYGTPQDLVPAPGVNNQVFITTRNGDILTMSNGVISSTPFLNMPSAGINVYTGGEGGLLGIAFSPTYSTPGSYGFGKFYTFDTEPYSSMRSADFSSPELAPMTGVQPNNQIVIREWTATNGVVSPTSRVLMTINHPQSNHQGGTLRFGPDGDLYIGLGDGGGANDNNGSANDSTDGHNNQVGNGQDNTVPFGKILRINPNRSAGSGFSVSANGQYSIPNSNPALAGPPSGGNASVMKEIYANGMRNPYRMSFDSATGKLYVGNVGQGNIESVDVVTPGGNYGWPYFEGTRNNQADSGRTAPVGFALSTPAAEYTHNDGIAVIGGEVYHGSADPALDGKYIFGDLAGVGNDKSRLFYFDPSTGSGPYTINELQYDTSSGGLSGPPANLYGFGHDSAGNLYSFYSNGQIVEFVPEPVSSASALAALICLAARRRRSGSQKVPVRCF